MPRAVRGILVECDPSIKALVISIDNQSHNVIIEDLDDTHLVINPDRVAFIRAQLDAMLAENTFNPIDPQE